MIRRTFKDQQYNWGVTRLVLAGTPMPTREKEQVKTEASSVEQFLCSFTFSRLFIGILMPCLPLRSIDDFQDYFFSCFSLTCCYILTNHFVKIELKHLCSNIRDYLSLWPECSWLSDMKTFWKHANRTLFLAMPS